MAKRYFTCFSCILFAVAAGRRLRSGWRRRTTRPNFHVVVDLVQLNVAVTDNKGNYVTGLKPSDFVVTEDGIRQKIATFGEGNQAPQALTDIAKEQSDPKTVEPEDASCTRPRRPRRTRTLRLVGANVFILFDTSNYMYRGFAFAQDAIADFVRSLDGPDRIALYAYSRDLFRAAPLTPGPFPGAARRAGHDGRRRCGALQRSAC